MLMGLVWFQYSQYAMICKRVPSTKVSSLLYPSRGHFANFVVHASQLKVVEPAVIGLVILHAIVMTVVPSVTGFIGRRPQFYVCW